MPGRARFESDTVTDMPVPRRPPADLPPLAHDPAAGLMIMSLARIANLISDSESEGPGRRRLRRAACAPAGRGHNDKQPPSQGRDRVAAVLQRPDHDRARQ
jgi:hypothetical protein